ncbi:MAG: sugar ABC transporter permease [Armatimonadetes bacterium]|nr:sugar ABC transporter permease [Anaerolineae bacterium]
MTALLSPLLDRFLSLFDLILIPLQRRIGIQRMGYFFVLPNLLIFGVFILFPMLLNFYYGFTSGQSMLLQNREVIGTANFERLLTCEDYANFRTCDEDRFWRALGNTGLYVVLEVGGMVLLALVTALALNSKIKGRGFFRSIFFYPVLLSPVVVALIWKWILQTDNGILNGVIVGLGGEKQPFTTDANWSLFWVIIIGIWAQMGFYTLILLAGLQAIPRELYEAASVEGANPWSKFRAITLPLLMPTMTVVLVLALIRAVQVFDQVFVLTGGGPGTATLYMVQYIYTTAFTDRNFGIAAGASLLLAMILLVLTLAQLRIRRGALSVEG